MTGAYSATNSAPRPSFILMAVQGEDVVAFIYELINDQVDIKSLEFSVKKWYDNLILIKKILKKGRWWLL